SDGRPRFIQIKGIGMEAEPQPNMLYLVNTDEPGFIGAVGMKTAEQGVNIATFHLGRAAKGGEAITLLGVDDPLDASTLAAIQALPQVHEAKALAF
ncbi:MAG: phosphoglycerate dehydrogenase, partial [Pseudomonadota bacterium]